MTVFIKGSADLVGLLQWTKQSIVDFDDPVEGLRSKLTATYGTYDDPGHLSKETRDAILKWASMTYSKEELLPGGDGFDCAVYVAKSFAEGWPAKWGPMPADVEAGREQVRILQGILREEP